LTPVVFDAVSAVLGFLHVPDSFCKAVKAYGSQKVLDNCDSSIDSCAGTTNRIAKQTLKKSSDASIHSSFSIRNWFASWF